MLSKENQIFQDICRANNALGGSKEITDPGFYTSEKTHHCLKEDDKPNTFRYPRQTYT